MRRVTDVLALGAALWATQACIGDSITAYPRGGGVMNSPGKCSIGAASAAWVNARLSGNRTLPVDCPYKVNVVNQYINFAAELFGPKSTNSQYGSGGVLGPIISLLDNTSVMPSVGANWSKDPAVSTGLVMIFTSGSYAAGHYPVGGPGPWSNDSGRVQVFGATTGIALAFVQLSGRATVAPGYVVVPSEVVAQVTAPFRAVTAVDTSSFNYVWQVDGVSVSSPNDADFATTWSLAGPHQVRVLATHAGGIDTIATSVMVKLNIALFGSSVVTTGCPVEYMANVSGGTSPLTYVWRLDGAQVGGNASTYNTTVTWSGSRTVTVDVTDSRGYTHYKGITVTGTSNGTCQFRGAS